MIRHLFAGGSTPKGFVNHFDYIMPLETAKRRYFLKGSSGSGKSTFMKRMAAAFADAGYGTELFHCANDADSLDGLTVIERGLCFIDGTAPHVRDPEVPIAVDMIINFADFIDGDKAAPFAGELKSLLRRKSVITGGAMGVLRAAGELYLADKGTAADAGRLARELLADSAAKAGTGRDRKLFLSAVTPQGVISYAGTALAGYKVIGLRGAAADTLLAALRNEALARGQNTESFFCPFAPDAMEYLLLPEEKTAFAAVGGRYCYAGRVDAEEDLSGYAAGPGLERARALFEQSLDYAVSLMKESVALHARIEEIYVNAIDFAGINAMTESLIKELLH